MKIEFVIYRYDKFDPSLYSDIREVDAREITKSLNRYPQITEIEAGLIFINDENKIWNAYYGKDGITKKIIIESPRYSVNFLAGFIDLLKGKDSAFIFHYEYSKTIMQFDLQRNILFLTDTNMLRNIKNNAIKDNTISFNISEFRNQIISIGNEYVDIAVKLKNHINEEDIDMIVKKKLTKSLAINEWKKHIREILQIG
jgi:hypothetical protein